MPKKEEYVTVAVTAWMAEAINANLAMMSPPKRFCARASLEMKCLS